MHKIYVGSTVPFSGKGLITLGLGKDLSNKGLKVGYFKPLGKSHQKVEGNIITDRLAYFIYKVLDLKESVENLCPIWFTYELKVKALRGEVGDLMSEIKRAFEVMSKGKEVMLIGGAETMWLGKFLGISGFRIADTLGAKVILVDKYVGDFLLDSILETKEQLDDRLLGVVINWVKREEEPDIKELVIPWLEKIGVPVLGWLPFDAFLTSITVGELSERLGGRIICGHESLDNFVQNYLIGGMEVDKFFEYLRRTPNAAVIVGGDRADIQLVAIEQGAKCLVLTGNLSPNEIIISKAEQRNVPIVLSREHTYPTAKRIQEIGARLSLKEKGKLERGLALVNKHINFERIYQLLGI